MRGVMGAGGRAKGGLPAVILLLFFLHCAFTVATVYEVSPAGDDTAPGGPWRTIQHAADVMQPGDTCVVQPGIYREQVTIRRSGTPAQPITFRSEMPRQAVVDGSDVLTASWSPCASADDCGANPNWQRIYHTVLPVNLSSIFTPLYEDDEFTWLAQDPNPSDFFDFDTVREFMVVPLGDPSIRMNRTSITDPRVFSQVDPDFWKSARLAIWRIPNVVVYVDIRSFDPSTRTVFFDDIEGDLYADRDERYAILNHVSLIDLPGEMVYDNVSQRLYLWPYSDPALAVFTIGRRTRGIYTQGYSNIVIDGFKVQKQFADTTWWNQGAGITPGSTGISSSNVTVANNEVLKIRSLVGGAAINIGGAANNRAANNYVHDCQRCVGIAGGGTNITVQDNTISRASRNGIWFMGARNSVILNNTIVGIRGSHSNPWSVYLNSSNVLFADNRVFDSNNGGTFEQSTNLTLYNNLIDSGASQVHSWGGMDGVRLLNNIFLQGISLASSDKNVVCKNNILKGGGGGDRSSNIYIGLFWDQSPADGWTNQSGEILGPMLNDHYTVADASEVFVKAPRYKTTVTSFLNETVLHMEDEYNPVVSPGDYLTLDGDSAHPHVVVDKANVVADGGNYRVRVWFTPPFPARNASTAEGWRNATTDFVEDYHVKDGGLAQDSGTDVSQLLPAGMFPWVAMPTDLEGTPRPQGFAWDIGAYERADTAAYPAGDVDRDGTVNLQDLVIVAGNIGKASFEPRADLAPPLGAIDLYDLMAVVRNWGRSG